MRGVAKWFYRGEKIPSWMVKESSPKPKSIYLVICKPTGQAYVGQSTDAKNRLIGHRSTLRRGEHHSPALQSAWDRHGESAFIFVTVERGIDPLFAHAREQFWMWRFDGRLLNKSHSAHPDMSNDIRLNLLTKYTDEELIAELKRRNIAVMVAM